MSPLDRMVPDANAMAEAARQLAWEGGVDVDVMEGIVRRVSRRAQRSMFLRFAAVPSNDDGGGSG